MYYRCEHFKIQELVSPKVYSEWGSKAWWFIDQELCKTLDELRKLFDVPITINDWEWGGSYTQSGLRDYGSEYYSPFSAHSFGKAADLKIDEYDSDVAIQMIIDWKNEGKLPHLTRIELDTDGWIHIDVFNTQPNNNNLYVFYP